MSNTAYSTPSSAGTRAHDSLRRTASYAVRRGYGDNGQSVAVPGDMIDRAQHSVQILLILEAERCDALELDILHATSLRTVGKKLGDVAAREDEDILGVEHLYGFCAEGLTGRENGKVWLSLGAVYLSAGILFLPCRIVPHRRDTADAHRLRYMTGKWPRAVFQATQLLTVSTTTPTSIVSQARSSSSSLVPSLRYSSFLPPKSSTRMRVICCMCSGSCSNCLEPSG